MDVRNSELDQESSCDNCKSDLLKFDLILDTSTKKPLDVKETPRRFLEISNESTSEYQHPWIPSILSTQTISPTYHIKQGSQWLHVASVLGSLQGLDHPLLQPIQIFPYMTLVPV